MQKEPEASASDPKIPETDSGDETQCREPAISACVKYEGAWGGLLTAIPGSPRSLDMRRSPAEARAVSSTKEVRLSPCVRNTGLGQRHIGAVFCT